MLGGQACQVNLYQKSTGLYVDLYVGGILIVAGVLALASNLIVRATYLGFSGDLAFFDTQPGAAALLANMQPDQITYPGLGSRYFLAYLP